MNITHSTKGDPQKDTTITFSVHIYPPKDPNYPYNCKDDQGNPYDYYLVIDKKPWYNNYFTRTIKYGYSTITKKRQKAEPYYKEVIDYINTNYPLPQ
jgi:hypothetical protein